MGAFAEAMQNLAGEINQAADERKVAIRLISEEVDSLRNDADKFMREVQGFIHDLQDEVSKHARSTRKILSSEERARLRAMRNFMKETRAGLKSAFEVARGEREFSNKARIESTRQFMGGIRGDIAAGRRFWAERNSNGKRRHVKNFSDEDAPSDMKVSRPGKKTKKKRA